MQINFWEITKNSLPILWKMWPIWISLLIIATIRILFIWLDLKIDDWHIHRRFKQGEKWRSDRDLLQWLRGMKPSEFEDYIADLFRRLGFKAKAVGKSHDGGIDVIIEKNGIKGYIQCKKFINSKVAVGDIRDFYGALADRLANGKAYFVTTNEFTLEAEKFAEDKPIELINSHRLVKYIHLAEKENKSKETFSTNKMCPKCGNQLVERTGKYGKFLGCTKYPKCDYTIKQKLH